MRSFKCEMEQRADALQNAHGGWLELSLDSYSLGSCRAPPELSKLIPSLPYTGPSLVS